MKIIATLLVLGLTIIGWATVHSINRPNELSENVSLMLHKGESIRSLAQNLAQAEVINSPLLFRLMVRIQGIDKSLKAGEYMFLPHLNMQQVIRQLQNGEVFYRKITIPEGLTVHQIKSLLMRENNLSGDITVLIPEGSILPETYSFSKGDSRDSLVIQAQKAMQNVLTEVWQNRQVQILQNPQELLILASIIEKETGLSDERPDVAAVFVNRLQKGMKLQTDPTVIYALTGGESDLGRPLTKKDLNYDSPYNTYLNYGLPPQPICNPGKEAIKAAANPQSTDYLFFVASGNGGHLFAKNLAEHNHNVANYRKIIKNK